MYLYIYIYIYIYICVYRRRVGDVGGKKDEGRVEAEAV